MLASTWSLRAVGPATVLSHKCDVPSLLKDDTIVRDNRLSVHVMSAPRVTATLYCHPGRHANVVAHCLLTPCLNLLDIYHRKLAASRAKIMANFEFTYPRLLVFALHCKQVGKFSKNVFFFPIWLLILSMPHVRGCLKTSSQDNCVWSDPFCMVNSKNLQCVNMRAPPRNLSTYLCSLRVEVWDNTNTWTTTTTLAWYPQKIVVEHRLPPVLT